MSAPVAIGGVGGSGTRLVARIVAGLGVDTGQDLNPAHDNLWYTLLFKHADVTALEPAAFAARARLFVATMTGERALDPDEYSLLCALAAEEHPQHDREWLQDRALSMFIAAVAPRPAPRRWGWKEPNTHVALDQWRQVLPELRYIHVVRNGLDMAFSSNLNQLDLWGPWLLGRAVERAPRDALAYWCAAHRRVTAIGATMGGDFLALDYDRLCRDPEAGLAELASFLDAPVADAAALAGLVEAPKTLGRGREEPRDRFDPADLDYLRAIGHL